ncbi:serine/threonine protein kinase [Streptomyces subrutilus]|uniref:serine/threonine protein kinase n=1 Tax=Streptomyces subrutilus TaxID=36818 RepID=UPI0034150C53
MEEYAGRILAHRYRLPVPPSDAYELVETRAFDTRSGQEVLVRQVPLPEVVDAETLDGRRTTARSTPAGDLPAVRRAIEAAQAAAAVADHPRLDQVFDVFAEDGSLWIVSELVPARPLAALIADAPLSPYRAAEVASDVLTALRVLHAQGWTHRNITVRTVLVCDDGRIVLTGLAAGAAEEALCGYDPVPRPPAGEETGWDAEAPHAPAPHAPTPHTLAPGSPGSPRGAGPAAGAPAAGGPPYGPGPYAPDPGGTAGTGLEPRPAPGTAPGTGLEPAAFGAGSPEPAPGAGPHAGHPFHHPGPGHPEPGRPPQRPQAPEPGYAPLVAPGYDTGPRYTDHITPGRPEDRPDRAERPDLKAAARAGAIAAYRAGAQAAAARVTEQRKAVAEPRPEGSNLPQGYSYPYGGPDGSAPAAWHGATPRRQPALPPAPEPHSLPPARPAPQDGARRDPAPAGPTPPSGPAPHPAPDPGPAPHPGPRARPYTEPQPQQQQPESRAALPAQLALPQGYRQAEAPYGPGAGAGASEPVRPQPRPTAPEPPAPPAPAPAAPAAPADGWDGPRTGLDAERARQTRMAVVGAVTERWAPEQAGPVHGHWQLAAPVGPATDLWALGALLYRAVQGHAPYPEDSVGELVEMVCAEPPAFAEECGALRPVVESLLRQDPTERPDFEELRGWLRSLVRSAPEPDAGFGVLPMAEADPARLPVVRRRGDLHGRHRNPAAPRKPLALGRLLLVGVLVLLAGAVAYAMLFLPRSAEPQAPGGSAQGPARQSPSQVPTGTPESKPAPQTTTPPPEAPAPAPAPAGYTTQQDPEHFEIAVPEGWERRGINEAGQVRYTGGQFTLTVVPGRDRVEGNPDPAAYQKDKEQELTPYRTSTWSTVGDVKSTKVGQQLRATGRYTWIDGTGRNVFARNFVVALGGTYHVVMVTGPEDEQGKVTEVFEKATASYKSGG